MKINGDYNSKLQLKIAYLVIRSGLLLFPVTK